MLKPIRPWSFVADKLSVFEFPSVTKHLQHSVTADGLYILARWGVYLSERESNPSLVS